MAELDACVRGGEVPVHAGGLAVVCRFPRSDLLRHRPSRGDAAVETQAGEDGEFDLCQLALEEALVPDRGCEQP